MGIPILYDLLMRFVCAIVVMIVHEVPKAIVANAITHPIYRKKGDFKLNIFSYIDPIGVIMFIFTSTGWQKPAEYNPARFRNKEKGLSAVASMGLFSNLLLMILLIPLFFSATNVLVGRALFLLIYFNFAITIVNLLPVPPFDMTKLIYSHSPNTYFKLIQNERIIHAVFILLAIYVVPPFVQSLFIPLFHMF
jgi:Zn-dependent protease